MDALSDRRTGTRTWGTLGVLLCLLVAVPAASATPTRIPKTIRYAKVRHACAEPRAGHATCFALVRVPVSSTAAGQVGVNPYAVGSGALEAGPAGGLTPAELATAYGYAPSASGEGQTIAIVDAYDDPNIEADLGEFDTQYKLTSCTKADKCLEKMSQTGSTSLLPAADTTGWSVEITLDVETAHSTCPKCKILLVEANSSSFADLSAAVSEAVAKGATEVSNSYGGPEAELGATEKGAYNHPGVVIAAATGDYGYDNWTVLNSGYIPPAKPNLPASFPSVVAVGGTTLDLTGEGQRESETVWNGTGPLDAKEFEGASGGGCSTKFTAQLWQQHVAGFPASGCGSKRLAADVAAVADPLTGFDIYDSYNCGKTCEEFKAGHNWLTIGGTSLATPLISSLYALAGGADGVSYPALTLYGHVGDAASLFDVTGGGNGFCDGAPVSECGHPDTFYGLHVDCEYTTACDAAPGYDGPSGVGTPNGLGAFKPLLPTAVLTSPAELVAGTAASFSSAGSHDPYPGGSISGWKWSWGDGTGESVESGPAHAFAVGGDYTVSLTVTDNYGLSSVADKVAVHVLTQAEAKQKREQEEAAAKKLEEEAAGARKLQEELAAKSTTGAQGILSFQTRAVPDAELVGTSLRVSPAGVFAVKLSCPAGEGSCAGTLTLRTLTAVSAGKAAHARASILTLAVHSFTVPGGKVATVTLHLSRRALGLLRRVRVLRARALILAHDPAGATHTAQAVATLRLVRAGRGGH